MVIIFAPVPWKMLKKAFLSLKISKFLCPLRPPQRPGPSALETCLILSVALQWVHCKGMFRYMYISSKVYMESCFLPSQQRGIVMKLGKLQRVKQQRGLRRWTDPSCYSDCAQVNSRWYTVQMICFCGEMFFRRISTFWKTLKNQRNLCK